MKMDWKKKFNQKPVQTETLQSLKWGYLNGEWKLFPKAIRSQLRETMPDMKFYDELTEEMKGVNNENHSGAR